MSEGRSSGFMISGGGTHGEEWPAEDEEGEGEGGSKEKEQDGAAVATPLVAAGGGGAQVAGSDADTAAAVVENLRVIVEYLVKERAVHVCLCTLPLVGAPTSLRARAIAGVNRQIKAMAKRSVRPLSAELIMMNRAMLF